jgi:ABC-type cobalamin/Fe3+-siderophores transport system ATPase subunit
MSLEVSLTSLTFSDGRVVPIAPASVTVIVGPNNAGKSQALRDIQTHLAGDPRQPQHEGLVVRRIEVRADGTEQDLGAWLQDHANEHPGGGQQRQFSVRGGGAGELQLREAWQLAPPFGPLAPFFFTLVGGAERLTLADSAQIFDPSTQPPSSPLQTLLVDEARERSLADATREAFSVSVLLNRVAGPNLHLHVGELAGDVGLPLITNETYRDAINDLPQITQQGDGLRAYVGIVLLLAATDYLGVMLDEPEAFLHPPQERALGRRIAKQARQARSQVIIATHSLDILLGVLSDETVPVTVVRLRREKQVHAEINHAAVLEPADVRTLWSDPIIRFSNALDGIFHRGVVICEGDADARFYDATLQSVRARAKRGEHELLFLHCGGKHRIHTMARALRGIDVPARVICDIDVLREEQPLRNVVEALGGAWDQVASDWAIVRSDVDSGSGIRPRVSDVKEGLDTLLSATEESRITPHLEKEVRSLVRTEDSWQTIKNGGAAALPAGNAAQAWGRLDVSLRSYGLFVVPVGTLERWNTEQGGHGPRWVVPMLEAGFQASEGPHATFVDELDASIK